MAEEKPAEEQVDLSAELVALSRQLDDESRLQSQFTLEASRVKEFWMLTRKEITESMAMLRNVNRECDELQEAHLVQKKEYQMRINHLLFEYQNELTKGKTDSFVAQARQQDDERALERELQHDRRLAKQEKKGGEVAYTDLVLRIKLGHDQRVSELNTQYEQRAREIQVRFEAQMKELRDQLDAQRRQEINALNQAKREHIKKITDAHLLAFADIKSYYNDFSHQDHFNVVEQLKDQLAEKKKEEAAQRKMLAQVTQDSKREQEPLDDATREVTVLKQRLKAYKKDKLALEEATQELTTLTAQHESLSWEHEVLLQRFTQVKRERDRLYDQFEKAVFQIQQHSGFHSLLLERKLRALNDVVERKEAQLSEILAASNLEPAASAQVSQGLQEILQSKNTEIRQLQDDLRRLTKAHQDVIRFYEAKMKEFGIPLEELGFQPLVTHVVIPRPPTAPSPPSRSDVPAPQPPADAPAPIAPSVSGAAAAETGPPAPVAAAVGEAPAAPGPEGGVGHAEVAAG